MPRRSMQGVSSPPGLTVTSDSLPDEISRQALTHDVRRFKGEDVPQFDFGFDAGFRIASNALTFRPQMRDRIATAGNRPPQR